MSQDQWDTTRNWERGSPEGIWMDHWGVIGQRISEDNFKRPMTVQDSSQQVWERVTPRKVCRFNLKYIIHVGNWSSSKHSFSLNLPSCYFEKSCKGMIMGSVKSNSNFTTLTYLNNITSLANQKPFNQINQFNKFEQFYQFT